MDHLRVHHLDPFRGRFQHTLLHRFQIATQNRQRCTQIVGNIRRHLAAGLGCSCQISRHLVKRNAQLAQLILRADRYFLCQFAICHFTGGCRQSTDRACQRTRQSRPQQQGNDDRRARRQKERLICALKITLLGRAEFRRLPCQECGTDQDTIQFDGRPFSQDRLTDNILRSISTGGDNDHPILVCKSKDKWRRLKLRLLVRDGRLLGLYRARKKIGHDPHPRAVFLIVASDLGSEIVLNTFDNNGLEFAEGCLPREKPCQPDNSQANSKKGEGKFNRDGFHKSFCRQNRDLILSLRAPMLLRAKQSPAQ